MIIINQAHWNVDSTSPGGFLPSVLFFFSIFLFWPFINWDVVSRLEA